MLDNKIILSNFTYIILKDIKILQDYGLNF
jgi:CRISPR/Cas system CMR-associated protein Cmr3 (group 5 of RAMP superfamily)